MMKIPSPAPGLQRNMKMSFPRKRESRTQAEVWIPTPRLRPAGTSFVGMTDTQRVFEVYTARGIGTCALLQSFPWQAPRRANSFSIAARTAFLDIFHNGAIR